MLRHSYYPVTRTPYPVRSIRIYQVLRIVRARLSAFHLFVMGYCYYGVLRTVSAFRVWSANHDFMSSSFDGTSLEIGAWADE